MGNLYHKTGDTLSLTCTYTDSSGNPINITSYTIASKVKAVGFEDTITVTKTNAANGVFTLSATATDTASWPVTVSIASRLFCDVQFTSGSVVQSSETFQIIVVQDIT